MTAERPANLKEALNTLSNEELKGIISWADSRQADRRAKFPPPPAPEPSLPEGRQRSGQGWGGAVRKVASGVRDFLRPLPVETGPARSKSFIEEIDDILAGESGPEGKVFASPRRLAGYLQSLPLPQGASLQNPNIEILDGRSARAQGEISKWGKSSFIVMLASDREAGELQVQSHNLTAVAGRHKSHVGEINQALGNIISTLKDQLNGQLADKAWKTAGFSIRENGNDFVIKFNRELIDQEKEQLQEVRQAREELQGSLDRRQQWAKRLKKERPSNREIVLASPLFKDKTQEEIEAMANELFESDADSIVKGKFGLDEELMQKLLQLYHPDEVRVLEDLIIQKLDQAGDEPRASAWRTYLAASSSTPEVTPSREQLAGADAFIEKLMQGGMTRDQAIEYLVNEAKKNQEQAKS